MSRTADSAVENAKQTPSGTVVLKGKLHRVRRGNGHTYVQGDRPAPRPTVRKPARVARMLAFAHKLKQAIEAGEYEGQADAARQLGLTRARLSQLMDLTCLTPQIQEEILFLERVDGTELTSERKLRPICQEQSWQEQLIDFNQVQGRHTKRL
jgi:predicted XRE-type DNA-binding protein